MITSPRWRPFSAASLAGSIAEMTTPWVADGRLSALAIWGVSGCSDRPSDWLAGDCAGAPLPGVSGVSSCPVASSSLGRVPTVTTTRIGLPLRMMSIGTRDPTRVLAIMNDTVSSGFTSLPLMRTMTSPCCRPAAAAARPGETERMISPRSLGRPSDWAMSSSTG
jgi:hypothetical protein